MSAADRAGRDAHDQHCEADTCHCGYAYARHEGYGCGCPGFVAIDRGCECAARRRPPLPAVIGLETWPESPEARRELVALLRGADRHALLAWAHAQLAAPVTREAWCALAGVTWQALRAARRASPALAVLPVVAVVGGRARKPAASLSDAALRMRASRDRARGVGPPKRKPGRAKRPA